MMKAAAAGVLLAFAAGPSGRWYIVPVALALLWRAIDEPSKRKRFRRSFVAFFLMFIVSLAWTKQFSGAGWPVLAAVQALFFAMAVSAVPQRERSARLSGLAFAAALTLAELVRISVPFGGLPMGGFTTSASRSPLAWTASVTGELGLVFLLALLGVALSELVRFRHAARSLALLPVAALVALSVIDVKTKPTGDVEVTTVQAGGPQALLRDEQDPERVFDGHYELSRDIAPARSIVVWPEDVIDVDQPIGDTPEGRAMAALAQSLETFVGAGVVERVTSIDAGNNRFRNAFVVWGPDGTVVDRYEKQQRVPFGEYVPGRAFFDKFADLSQAPADAIAGTGEPVLQMGARRAAVAISYEGLFSRRVRDGVENGASFVIIPTNAASYESPRVARTQVESARFRAIESGRSVVQSAPTGISAFVRPNGSVTQTSTVGQPSVMTHAVEQREGETLYTRLGNTPLVVLSSAILLFTWGYLFGRREQDRGLEGDVRRESC